MKNKRLLLPVFLPLSIIGYEDSMLTFVLLLTIVILLCFILWNQYEKKRKVSKETDQEQTLLDELLDIHFLNTIVIDKNNKILRINGPCIKELCLNYESVIGQPVETAIDIRQGKKSIVCDLLASIKPNQHTVYLPLNTIVSNLKSKSNFMAQGVLIGTYHSGKLTYTTIIFRNIEGELTQEYVLNMALSRTKIFSWFYDIEKQCMIIDSRWFAHLGLPMNESGTIPTEEFASLLHPDDRDGLINALTGQIKGKLNKNVFTYRLRRSDGTWEWFEEQSIYLGGVNDAPHRVVGVCQSIQEHKNTEERLLSALNKAEESDRLKSAFLANMSHEIRTPLNAIVGFSSLLQSSYTELDCKEIEEYTTMIEKNSQILMLLISDILDLSKIDSNTMNFHSMPVSLNSLMTDINNTHKVNMNNNVKLHIDIPETDTVILSDSLRLGQVMNNLINNAIKFTSEGYICFGYNPGKRNTVELFVEDTGKGIPEEDLTHIFERFYKGDSFIQGTGLGLTICKTIVDHFNGRIEVQSKVGKGSRFTIYLPIEE